MVEILFVLVLIIGDDEMDLKEELEKVFEDVHIECDYQPIDIPINTNEYFVKNRTFLKEENCKSNVLGRDNGRFFGVKIDEFWGIVG